MQEKQNENRDFVMVPRCFKDDLLANRLTQNEYDVLIHIWMSANPYNGYFTADYKGLANGFSRRISYDSMRHIISGLRRKQYISFLDHRGKTGSFAVYPVNYSLTSGTKQTLEYLQKKLSNTTKSQPSTQPALQLEHNSSPPNYNFLREKDALVKKFSIDSNNPKITTAKTDNDNKKNNNEGKEKRLTEEKVADNIPIWRR